MPKDGGHQRCQPGGKTILQRRPDQVLRAQTQKSLRTKKLVGKMHQEEIRQGSDPQR